MSNNEKSSSSNNTNPQPHQQQQQQKSGSSNTTTTNNSISSSNIQFGNNYVASNTTAKKSNAQHVDEAPSCGGGGVFDYNQPRPPALGEEEKTFCQDECAVEWQQQPSSASPQYYQQQQQMELLSQQGGKQHSLHNTKSSPVRSSSSSSYPSHPSKTHHHHQYDPMGDSFRSGASSKPHSQAGAILSSSSSSSQQPPPPALLLPAASSSAYTACLLWAQSLHNLLKDPDGSELFLRYLKSEGGPQHADALDFWFACEGLKKHNDPDIIQKLVKLIYKTYCMKSVLPIKDELRREITKNLKTSNPECLGPPVTLFDEAQQQVEHLIQTTTYPNFLNSDTYLQYLQSVQNLSGSSADDLSSESEDASSCLSSSASTTSSNHNNATGGATIAAPSMIINSGRHQQQQDTLMSLMNLGGGGGAAGVGASGVVGAPGIPLPTLHEGMEYVVNAAHQLTTTPGTGTASASTGYHTPTVQWGGGGGAGGATGAGTPLPSSAMRLTKNMLLRSQNYRAMDIRPKSETYAGLFVSTATASSYRGGAHAGYHSYNPVSRQDSEMQSISSHSDARTESDNLSLADSTFTIDNNNRPSSSGGGANTSNNNGGGGGGRTPSTSSSSRHPPHHHHHGRHRGSGTSKSAMEAKHTREMAQLNREQDDVLQQALTVVSRTQRMMDVRSRCVPMDLQQHAAILREKLEGVKRQQETQELLDKKLKESDSLSSLEDIRNRSEIAVHHHHHHHHQSQQQMMMISRERQRELECAAVREKLCFQEDFDQDILDNHVSRVFSDQTMAAISPPPGGAVALNTAAAPAVLLLSPRPYSPQQKTTTSTKYSSSSSRRKDKDVVSTFSGDSGNVHDYVSESSAEYNNTAMRLSSMVRSKSIPEYSSPIEDAQQQQQQQQATSAHNNNKSGFSRNAPCRRSASFKKSSAGLTDSGVSVVSEDVATRTSGAAVIPVATDNMVAMVPQQQQQQMKDNRVINWLLEHKNTKAMATGSTVGAGVAHSTSGASQHAHSEMGPMVMTSSSIGLGNNKKHVGGVGGSGSTTGATMTSRSKGNYGGGEGDSRSNSLERTINAGIGGVGGGIGAGTGMLMGMASGGGGLSSTLGPAQPFVADPSMPPPPLPNTSIQLEEARRRLMMEDDQQQQRTSRSNRQRPLNKFYDPQSTSSCQSTLKKSVNAAAATHPPPPLPQSATLSQPPIPQPPQHSPPPPPTTASAAPIPTTTTNNEDLTILVAWFCDEQVPYLIKVPGTQITLRQFKEYLPKKGNYRYFFKTVCEDLGNQVTHEEVTNDAEVLPLWEGKIMAQVKPID